MDTWYSQNLVCPVDHLPLEFSGDCLVSASGRRYPVVDGIPVMLLPEVTQTIGIATASLARAHGESIVDQRAPELHLESLGIGEQEKDGLVELDKRDNLIDPVVSFLVGATSGHSYKHLVGALGSYPIPDLRLPKASGETFLDLGCSWGRWCIAAAGKGYAAIGLDPSLGAVLAARRVARQLRLNIKYLVGDARYLPFAPSSVDTVFSYSVLQHLSKDNVRRVLREISRVLKQNGTSLVQMPNFLGIRCIQQQLRRRLRAPRGFEVRYWSLPELARTFTEEIGSTEISVDCYFGLGLQGADADLMPPHLKFVAKLSDALRSASENVKLLKYVADSVYVRATREDPSA